MLFVLQNVIKSVIQQILFHVTLFVYSCQDVEDFCNYYLQTYGTRQCSNDCHLLFNIYAMSQIEGLFTVLLYVETIIRTHDM